MIDCFDEQLHGIHWLTIHLKPGKVEIMKLL
jgi:hypothetical protein